MFLIPGRPTVYSDDISSWWGGLIYAIGVFAYFIAWFVILLYVLFWL